MHDNIGQLICSRFRRSPSRMLNAVSFSAFLCALCDFALQSLKLSKWNRRFVFLSFFLYLESEFHG